MCELAANSLRLCEVVQHLEDQFSLPRRREEVCDAAARRTVVITIYLHIYGAALLAYLVAAMCAHGDDWQVHELECSTTVSICTWLGWLGQPCLVLASNY